MNNNLTELIIISDCSGSMVASQNGSQQAINDLINTQKGKDTQCKLTIVDFADKHKVICDGQDVNNFTEYELKPSGLTALLDAVGTAITSVSKRIYESAPEDRPGLVSVVISTDGYENASKEFNKPQILDLINSKKAEGWIFTFVGIELSEEIGESYGLTTDNVINVKRSNHAKGMGAYSSKLANTRNLVSTGATQDEVFCSMSYTQEEKTEINE